MPESVGEMPWHPVFEGEYSAEKPLVLVTELKDGTRVYFRVQLARPIDE